MGGIDLTTSPTTTFLFVTTQGYPGAMTDKSGASKEGEESWGTWRKNHSVESSQAEQILVISLPGAEYVGLEGSDREQEAVSVKSPQPWFVVPVLVCSVIAVSAAGAFTKLMKGAAPVSQAGWRLQLTSVVLLPGFLWQWARMTVLERRRALLLTNIGILFLSAIALAFHFGLWTGTPLNEHTFVYHLPSLLPSLCTHPGLYLHPTSNRGSPWSQGYDRHWSMKSFREIFGEKFQLCSTMCQFFPLALLLAHPFNSSLHINAVHRPEGMVWSLDHTSLPHSLLLVTMPPVILAAIAFLRGQALSRMEMFGVALGVGGALIMAAGTKVENDKDVTLLGDFVAFLGAAAFAAYIVAGKHLRGWIPLYVYAFPVTAVAAVFVTLAGIVLEGMERSASGEISGPFRWLKKDYFLLNVALALGPGFVGHTGLNAVLRHSSSLLVTMAITVEPLLGSLIAWALHVSGIPGVWTCMGGAVMLIGTVWVSYFSEKHKDEVNCEQKAEHWSHSHEDYQSLATREDEDAKERKDTLSGSAVHP